MSGVGELFNNLKHPPKANSTVPIAIPAAIKFSQESTLDKAFRPMITPANTAHIDNTEMYAS